MATRILELKSTNPRCCGIPSAVMLGILLLAPETARALNPDRPLSQALLRIWQTQQGLPRASIFSIRQTTSGYLWLGTQSGLYRFDGVRFVPGLRGTADAPTASSGPWIQDLVEDPSGKLWVATDGQGLFRQDSNKMLAFGRTEGLPSQVVHCVAVDSRGELWAGTDQGLFRFHEDRFQAIDDPDRSSLRNIRALGPANDGTLWIGRDGASLARWDGSRIQGSFTGPPRGSIQQILVAPDGRVWIGTTDGLFVGQGKGNASFAPVVGLEHELIHCLAHANPSGIWVGTQDGLRRIQGERVERFQTRDGLSQSTVFSLCEDQEGSLWVGTKNGLNQLVDRRTLLPFTMSEGLPSNETGPILQDAAGNVWVGTLDAGLAKFDGRGFVGIATEQNGLLSNKVLSLADGGPEGLWIGTDKGLCALREGHIDQRFTTAQGLPANTILTLAKDASGALWAGTSTGVAELREGRFVPPETTFPAATQAVHSLINDSGRGLIAASSTHGLFRIVQRQIEPLATESQELRDVDSLFLDRNHHLWVSLRGVGLARYDGTKFERFTIKDGLYDDNIFGIAEDDRDRIWMACSRGVFSVPRSDFQDHGKGSRHPLRSMPYSPTDALRTIECKGGIQPSIWKMRDGRIWFSTIRGIMVVDPERASQPLPPARVVIEEIRVDGQEMQPSQIRQLPAGRNNLHFHYTTLSFAVFNRLTFRHKLEGYDREWIDAGQRREAFYTNLPPGTYRFKVQAVPADGTSGEEATASVDLTLVPRIHQRPWFIPLAIGGLIATSWFAYRLRIRRIQKGLQVVIAERSRIARELHDTLIQGFAGVTMQLQAFGTRLSETQERDALEAIIADAGGCLRQARRSVAGLRNAVDRDSDLPAAIALTARQLTETTGMELHLRLTPMVTQLDPDREYNLLQVVREAITNAVKHSGGKRLEVSLRSDPRQLTITIRDDGCGFDVRRQEQFGAAGHYGLIGMRERVTQIGAEIAWRSERRMGTTVTIRYAASPVGAMFGEMSATPPQSVGPPHPSP